MKLKDIEIPYKISNSKISLFRSCPVQFYFRYLTDLGDRSTIWPGNLFGKAEHAVLEDVLKMLTDNISSKQIVKNVKGLFEKHFLFLIEDAKEKKRFKQSRAYQKEEFLKSGEKYALTITKFVLGFFPEKPFKIFSEYEIFSPYFKNPQITFQSIVDMIFFYNENCYDVFDLKITTESEKFYFIDWDFEFQNTLYEHVTHEHFGFPFNSFSFLVLNRENSTLFLKQKLYSETEERYQKLFSYVDIVSEFVFQKDDDRNLRKLRCNNNDVCHWCNYKKECTQI